MAFENDGEEEFTLLAPLLLCTSSHRYSKCADLYHQRRALFQSSSTTRLNSVWLRRTRLRSILISFVLSAVAHAAGIGGCPSFLPSVLPSFCLKGRKEDTDTVGGTAGRARRALQSRFTLRVARVPVDFVSPFVICND